MRIRAIVAPLVAVSLIWSSSAMAEQRHVVDAAALHQAVADQAAKDQQNRDAVLNVLHQEQVRELAGRLGLDVTRAEGAVAALDGAELAQLADTARSADLQLAGGRGNTIVISTTALLLIIIIVILLVR
jgi:hypothetical protein